MPEKIDTPFEAIDPREDVLSFEEFCKNPDIFAKFEEISEDTAYKNHRVIRNALSKKNKLFRYWK